MKQDYTVFNCDTCGKQETKQRGLGFPYENGWVYIHRFNGQVAQVGRKGPTEYDMKEGHFCSDNCAVVKITGIVQEARRHREVVKELVQEQPVIKQDTSLPLEEFSERKLADAPVYIEPIEPLKKPSFINTFLRRDKHDRKPAEEPQPSQS